MCREVGREREGEGQSLFVVRIRLQYRKLAEVRWYRIGNEWRRVPKSEVSDWKRKICIFLDYRWHRYYTPSSVDSSQYLNRRSLIKGWSSILWFVVLLEALLLFCFYSPFVCCLVSSQWWTMLLGTIGERCVEYVVMGGECICVCVGSSSFYSCSSPLDLIICKYFYFLLYFAFDLFSYFLITLSNICTIGKTDKPLHQLICFLFTGRQCKRCTTKSLPWYCR